MDCRPAPLRSDAPTDELPEDIGLGEASTPIRLPILPVAFEPALSLRDGCKDLSFEGLRLSEPNALAVERLLDDGVRLGSGALTDGRDGLVEKDLFVLGDGLERKERDGWLCVIEVFGRLGLMDGLDRLGVRLNEPLLGALGRGAD